MLTGIHGDKEHLRLRGVSDQWTSLGMEQAVQEDADEHDLVGVVDPWCAARSTIVVRLHTVRYVALVIEPILAVEFAARIIHVHAWTRILI